MAARNPGQRRRVLRELNEIRKLIKFLKVTWDVRSTIYLYPEDRPPGTNVYQRRRRPEEYPEEQATSWAHLYNASDEAIKKLTTLRELARIRYHEIQDAEADRSRGDA